MVTRVATSSDIEGRRVARRKKWPGKVGGTPGRSRGVHEQAREPLSDVRDSAANVQYEAASLTRFCRLEQP